MGRRVVVGIAFLVSVSLNACGGGGGGGSTVLPPNTPGQGGAATANHQVCDGTGVLCLGLDALTLTAGQSTRYVVTALNAAGSGQPGVRIELRGGSITQITPPSGTTDSHGQVVGNVNALFGGSAIITASAPDSGAQVFLRVNIRGAGAPTPTEGIPMTGVPATFTPTPGSAAQVATIYMETEPFSISSELGGNVLVRAIAFDSNNEAVNDVNLLFDFEPKVGTLRPITTRTRTIVENDRPLDGVAEIIIEIPPGEAPPGPVTVTASSPTAQGSVTFSIVPGAARRPPATVLLETSDARCGTESGGSIVMRAIVFDADNRALSDVNVLFLTDQGLGRFFPLVQRTSLVGNQDGVAETTLQIPVGAPVRVDSLGNIVPYEFRARAGGIEGTAQIYIVPGREPCDGRTTAGSGEPSSITLSAGNKAIRVRGNGALEVSQVRAEVKDSGNNEVPARRVRFFIDPRTTSVGATLLPANPGAGFCSQTPQFCGDPAPACPSGETCSIDPDNRFVALTDQAGNAQITVRAGSQIGTVTIGAEVVSNADEQETVPCSHPDDAGQRCIRATSVALTVSAGGPGRIALSLNTLFFNNQDGNLVTSLAAVVTDSQGNTVPDGTPVLISIGSLGDDAQVRDRLAVVGFPVTNGNPPCDVRQFPEQQTFPVNPQPGLAITCLIFPPSLRGADFTLVATSAGVSTSRVMTLPGAISELITAPNPARVRVTEDESGVSLITAVVLDHLGDPVPNVQLVFETEPAFAEFGVGNVPPWITRERTDSNGIATATLEIGQTGQAEGSVQVLVYGGGLPRVVANVVNVQYAATGPPPIAGQPQSIRFDSANPQTITVRGAAGPDQSIVRFLVVDSGGLGLAGVPVQFFVNGLGGARVTPEQVVTNAQGIAQTSVLAGNRTSPIQVTATVDVDGNGTADLVARSQVVNVVGGRPSAGRIDISPAFVNIAGGVVNGIQNEIYAFINDRFGNAVSPGTIVNFSSTAGSIIDQQPTDADGVARAILVSGQPPADGIVSILATTIGEEAFIDINGNGIRDPGEPFTDIAEPFIDVNGNGRFDPDVAGETFIDVNNNGVWDEAQRPGVWDQDAILFLQQDVTFSGAPILTVQPTQFDVIAGTPVDFTVTLADANGHAMTSRAILMAAIESGSASPGSLVGIGSTPATAIEIPDIQTFGAIVPGANQFGFTYVPPASVPPSGSLQVRINVILEDRDSGSAATAAPGRNGRTSFIVNGGIQAPPTATPTITPIPTATLTPTLTTTPLPTSTPTPTVPDTATPTLTFTPRPGAISFVQADPTSIGVRGAGVPEQSVVTFRLTDDQAQPIAGMAVRFSVQSIGGESLSPGQATTGADGTVSTVITSGRRTSSIRVRAELVANPSIFTLSNNIIVLGAPPAADRFSMAAQHLNVAGRVTLGLNNVITAFLNDRFGNAVPQGTAVSFLSNASSVVNPSPSDADGRSTATLITEGGRFPPDGIVRILGFTRGEEPFVDANGDGIYNPGEVFADVPEPFIDANGNGVYDPDDPFELFVDVNGNGVWDSAQNPGEWDGNAMIWDVIAVTFSGSTVVILEPSSGFVIPDGGGQEFTLRVSDNLNNPLVAGTTISISAGEGLSLRGLPASFTLEGAQSFGQTIEGINLFTFSVIDAQPGQGTTNQSVEVIVSVNSPPSGTAPGGNGSVSVSRVGTLLAAPTPTPTVTPTFTPEATSTPTEIPTNTNTPTATPTNTATPSATPTNTHTPTATPTNTDTPTETPTNTATPTATSTPTDTP